METTRIVAGGRNAFSAMIGVARATLHSWRHSLAPIKLNQALRWGWLTGLPLSALFSRILTPEEVAIRRPAVWSKKTRVTKPPTVEGYLDAIKGCLGRYQAPTKLILIRCVGGSGKHPLLNSPSVMREFSKARNRVLLIRRKQSVWAAVLRVHEAFVSIVETHANPTQRRVVDILKSGVMRDPVARRYLNFLRRLHHYGRELPDPKMRVPKDVQGFWEHRKLN